MKYLIKLYVWQPLFTEVIIHADNDVEVMNKLKNLKHEELEWKEHPIRQERCTYEIFRKDD